MLYYLNSSSLKPSSLCLKVILILLIFISHVSVVKSYGFTYPSNNDHEGFKPRVGDAVDTAWETDIENPVQRLECDHGFNGILLYTVSYYTTRG